MSPAVSELLVGSSGLQGPAPLQCRNQRDRKGQPVTSTRRLPSKTVQESDFAGSKKSGGKKKNGTMIHPTVCDVKYGHGVEIIK